ncbi:MULTISPECIES: WecB/TagA/CpsF family glycosyltransferase [Halomonas]|uniref:WecB/TagA/CpsF family glycosyltransferase n=1 Tax=Halomonas TaxID=2745 RepID=UPI001868A094|nr:WecB/TagA/CpsF family glycosyltransferase [Halomonas casei]
MMVKLEREFQQEKGVDCSFINPFSLGVVAQELSSEECAKIKFYADGIAIVIYARLFKNKKITRTSFDDTSLAPVVFNHALQQNSTVTLVGGTEDNIQKAKMLLEIKYPGLQVVLARSGYFNSDDEYKLFLKQSNSTDILIVGMGAGKQERVLLDMRESGWKGTGFTCGGYLDQLVEAKGLDYYPELVNKLHLRWLYRIFKEPRRLSKRYFKDYPYYLIKFGNKIR